MPWRNWFIIAAAYCSILLGAWSSAHLEVDFSLTTLSARSSEDYQNYQTYSKRFPLDEDGLSIALGSKTALKSLEDFTKLEQLRLDLLELDGVKSVLAITSVELPQKSLFGSRTRALLRLESQHRFEKSIDKLNDYPDVTPKFLSDDRTATRLFLEVDWSKTKLSEIYKIVRNQHYAEVHFMGKEVFSTEMKKNLVAEMQAFPLMAGVILLFLFFLWFRDVKSLIVVASILALNLSLITLLFWGCGIKIGLLTATTPLLILVLSFSDIVHILYKFKQVKKAAIEERLRDTILPLKLPLWLTTLTTGVAFALFFVSGVAEIMEFAFITCAGILLAYFTARYLLPVFLLSFRIRPFNKDAQFTNLAEKLIRVVRYRRAIILISVLFFGCLTWSLIARFEVENSYHQTFGSDTEIGKSLRFSDDKFEGVRTIEVILEAKTGLSEKITHIADEIEKELIDRYGCRSVFSVNTAIKRLNRYNHFGKPTKYSLPERIDEAFLGELIEHQKELGLVNAMTEDQQLYRIVGRLPDCGSAQALKKNEHLETRLRSLENDDHTLFISGFSFVKDQSTTRITLLILIGVGLSLIVAICVIGILFRSFRMALIAFFPNALPVLVGLALMSWTGIELNPTNAMSLSIILGLALDDTIYFLSSIKLAKQLNEVETVDRCLRENTFPAAVTSIILMIGFGILMFSSVESNRNSGFLIATMLFIALISDLVILPALLRAFWTKTKII